MTATAASGPTPRGGRVGGLVDRFVRFRTWRRANRLAVLVMVAATVVISLVTVAVPARAWWEERNRVAAREDQIVELDAGIAALEERRDDLLSDRTIEELARAEFNLVYEYEEPYAVLPAPERDAAWFHDWPW